jgi:hypothetical protein
LNAGLSAHDRDAPDPATLLIGARFAAADTLHPGGERIAPGGRRGAGLRAFSATVPRARAGAR